MAKYGGKRTSHIHQMCVALRPAKREETDPAPESDKSQPDRDD